MGDPYAAIAEAEPTLLKELARILELRAAHPRQQEMREAYLARLDVPADARVLEVGCGTGAVTRALASAGQIAPETAEALKAEARRRIAEGDFFGHIAYVALHARRPRRGAQTSAPQAS